MDRNDFETMDLGEVKDTLLRETAYKLYENIHNAKLNDLVKLSDKVVKLIPKLSEEVSLNDAEKEFIRRMNNG